MTTIRSILFLAFLYLSCLVIGIAGSPLLLFSRKINAVFVRWWCGFILGSFARIIGVRTIIKGEENLPDGPFILAPKHQAMWETIKVNRLFDDPATVMKKELMYIPVFGWWATKMRMIAVDRGAHAKALKKMMRDAQHESQAGRTIVIFPEGTRAIPGHKNPYKPGVAAIYNTLGVPVVPVALNSGRCWPRKGIKFRPGTITFEYLPAIAPGLSRKEFMAELETRIETATDKLLEEPA